MTTREMPRFTIPTFKVEICKSRPDFQNRLTQRKQINKRRNKKGIALKNFKGCNVIVARKKKITIADPNKVLRHLELFSENFITPQSNTYPGTNNRREEKTNKRRSINSFIAFRSYYSKCITKKVTQQKLSSVLSEFWSKNPKEQKAWDLLSHQYNKENDGQVFVEWIHQNHILANNPQNVKKNLEASKPFVENIFEKEPKMDRMNCLDYESFIEWLNESLA
ncbi:LAMI_0F00232g1_1 [Lachancea mirantina]|uniref:LAMI_0F00232g1_1 n=1 Tax=Lachancea mirantina TaxID=1230905 RepID=A0A1G4JV75_9SACH|nr:LAMI_0F00232g1_1 [Lachancea mirantina]